MILFIASLLSPRGKGLATTADVSLRLVLESAGLIVAVHTAAGLHGCADGAGSLSSAVTRPDRFWSRVCSPVKSNAMV